MAVRGKEPIRSKLCINYRLLEQVTAFNFLGFNALQEGATKRL
jgi:hypothetical protein